MSNVQLKVYPAKCTTCQSLAEAPLVCADCHALYEHVAGADYFELFGLPRTFDISPADLQRRYLAICRNIHPDRVDAETDEMATVALRLSAAVNRAFDTLRDPLSRAEYLLETSGGKSSSEDRRVAPELLGRVMMLREELDEARESGDSAAVDRIRREVEAERAAAAARISELAAKLGEPDDALRDALRLGLNAMKYYDNLLAGRP